MTIPSTIEHKAPMATSDAPAGEAKAPSVPLAPPLLLPSPPVTLSSMRVAQVLSNALSASVLGDAVPCAVFYDLTVFRARRIALAEAFPPSSLHCFAVKACPLVALLNVAAVASPTAESRDPLPMGAECASIGEVALALAAGIDPKRIVFDAPAKTDEVLNFCLDRGLHINANGLGEVDRIASLVCSDRQTDETGNAQTSSVIGLRINPQIQSTSQILESFTAATISKFGAPLQEERSQILEAYQRYPFLSSVHCHIGSQGCDLDALVEGVAAIVALAEEICSARPGQVTSINIGGGLSVEYDSDKSRPTFGEYEQLLRRHVPALFKYRVITEFGRKLVAEAGWVATRVEEVKYAGGRTIAICHAGADLFVRPVYVPSKWRHRIEVMSADGTCTKPGPKTSIDVAGPLCFSGDMLAVDRMLPIPEREDWLVVRDAGAYTLGAYSRLTSQLVPPVYGYEEDDPERLIPLKKRETLDALVQFWSP